jgi:hypothetical protein
MVENRQALKGRIPVKNFVWVCDSVHLILHTDMRSRSEKSIIRWNIFFD